jgi:hypothetical protein
MVRISLDTLIVKDTTKVIDRIVEGETLVIHLPSGNYFSLNAVGTDIWESIDGARTPRDLAEIVVVEYDVDVERAQADVLHLISDLVNEGLVVIKATEPA